MRIIATLDGRIVVFTGWRVAELLKEAGAKPIYAGTVGGWMIDRHRLGDVLAYLEQRNISVTVLGEGTHSASTPEGVSRTDTLAEDGGLW